MAVGAVAAIGIPIGFEILKKDIIPWLVTLADKAFGGKTPQQPDIGPKVKFPWVQSTATALDALLAQLTGALPSTDATIQGAIQDWVNQLKAAGVLVGHATALPPVLSAADQAPAGLALFGYAVQILQWVQTMPLPGAPLPNVLIKT